jgi:hypothetical protein
VKAVILNSSLRWFMMIILRIVWMLYNKKLLNLVTKNQTLKNHSKSTIGMWVYQLKNTIPQLTEKIN